MNDAYLLLKGTLKNQNKVKMSLIKNVETALKVVIAEEDQIKSDERTRLWLAVIGGTFTALGVSAASVLSILALIGVEVLVLTSLSMVCPVVPLAIAIFLLTSFTALPALLFGVISPPRERVFATDNIKEGLTLNLFQSNVTKEDKQKTVHPATNNKPHPAPSLFSPQ
jgi:hypothetical protein